MKKGIFTGLILATLLISCNKDTAIVDKINEYNLSKEMEGYHFGDKIHFPKEIMDNAESISISFGDKETSDLKINPDFFVLGANEIVMNIKTKSGKELSVDAIINVFAKNPEQELEYELIAEYPHNTENFVQGFQLEGNTIYESNGQIGKSNIQKYTLGSTSALIKQNLEDEYFAEGSTIVEDKIYQLTWQHKKGFIYDKNTLEKIGEFPYPNRIEEGWGLTYDGEHLILSDGSNQLYFLSPKNPQEIVKNIAVAGNTTSYGRINELEYHKGFIYANAWQRPYILKINPENGEVLAKIDFSELYKKHTKAQDDVLNGIAFKGENMLITGKNWDKIYEVKIK
ncbi:MAG: glutaminyl-peptide cyclotransferase [Flavobacteriaceae bacterium]|nr:glutaminyl-peptide cyclotransferase [Flavobacteriaceae bacterium]